MLSEARENQPKYGIVGCSHILIIGENELIDIVHGFISILAFDRIYFGFRGKE